MKDALKIVAEVTRLLEETPGAATIMDAIRTGRMSPEEAMIKLAEVALQAGHGEALVSASGRLEKAAQEHTGAPAVMTHNNGMQMLNPLVEAAIAERASLDGDVPEARSGPIPEGGYPAVPVLTDALDPVVVGMQLEQASQEIAEEIGLQIEDHSSTCGLILGRVESEATEKGLDATRALEVAKKGLPAIPNGVEGYRAGKVPSLRKAQHVPATTLAALSDEQRRHYAYKALSTTQGRRSLTGVVEKGIIDYLRAHSVNAVAGQPFPDTSVTTKWTVVLWGADDLAEDFNATTTAIHSMCSDVVEFITGHSEICIQVSPYHGITDRRFGWTLVAGPKERTT
jgi:hypothetical protein